MHTQPLTTPHHQWVLVIKVENSQFSILWHSLHMNNIESTTETVLFARNFQFQKHHHIHNLISSTAQRVKIDLIYHARFSEILQFHLSACNFSLNLCNAANWCKELTIFQFCQYPLLGNFSILSIYTQLCSHTACSLLVIPQGSLWKQSFFYMIFNSQNNIASMRRYPQLG